MAANAAGISPTEAVLNLADCVALVSQPPPAPRQAAVQILTRPTLLWDIDGTIAFLTELIVTALNARFNTEYIVSDFKTYWIEEFLPAEQAQWLTEQFARPITYASLAPDYSGIAALDALHQAGFDCVVSSDRPPDGQTVTEDWLEKWRVPYDELRLEGPGGKLKIAQEHGPDAPLILFDDDPRKWGTVARVPGCQVWCPARPWTPQLDPTEYPNVWVFDEWEKVLERLGVSPEVLIPQFSEDAGPAQAPDPAAHMPETASRTSS